MSAPRRSVRSLLVLSAVAASALLVGCTDDPGALPGATGTPGQTGSPSPAPSSSASGSPTTSPTEEPDGDRPATPIAADCATIVPLQALYDLDPNLALIADDAPTGAAAEAVAADGVACVLVHTSSGTRIELAVSAPGPAALAAAKADAGSPFDLGLPGLEGFSTGATVQGFTAEHRYSAESSVADPDLMAALLAIPFGVLG